MLITGKELGDHKNVVVKCLSTRGFFVCLFFAFFQDFITKKLTDNRAQYSKTNKQTNKQKLKNQLKQLLRISVRGHIHINTCPRHYNNKHM